MVSASAGVGARTIDLDFRHFEPPGSVRRPEGLGVEGGGDASVMPLPTHRAACRKPGDGSAASRPRRKTIFAPTIQLGKWAARQGSGFIVDVRVAGGVRVSLPSYSVTLEPAALDRKRRSHWRAALMSRKCSW
jgi:hypothetical protein